MCGGDENEESAGVGRDLGLDNDHCATWVSDDALGSKDTFLNVPHDLAGQPDRRRKTPGIEAASRAPRDARPSASRHSGASTGCRAASSSRRVVRPSNLARIIPCPSTTKIHGSD